MAIDTSVFLASGPVRVTVLEQVVVGRIGNTEVRVVNPAEHYGTKWRFNDLCRLTRAAFDSFIEPLSVKDLAPGGLIVIGFTHGPPLRPGSNSRYHVDTTSFPERRAMIAVRVPESLNTGRTPETMYDELGFSCEAPTPDHGEVCTQTYREVITQDPLIPRYVRYSSKMTRFVVMRQEILRDVATNLLHELDHAWGLEHGPLCDEMDRDISFLDRRVERAPMFEPGFDDEHFTDERLAIRFGNGDDRRVRPSAWSSPFDHRLEDEDADDYFRRRRIRDPYGR